MSIKNKNTVQGGAACNQPGRHLRKAARMLSGRAHTPLRIVCLPMAGGREGAAGEATQSDPQTGVASASQRPGPRASPISPVRALEVGSHSGAGQMPESGDESQGIAVKGLLCPLQYPGSDLGLVRMIWRPHAKLELKCDKISSLLQILQEILP